MKLKTFTAVIVFVLFPFLSSCELESQKLIELRNEVRYLETEISSLKAAPGFTFGEAFEYVDAGDYSEAINLLKELQNNFPEWNKEIVEKYLNEFEGI